ncbi:MAG: PilW family protein [Gammaproteobacteria bacterium]
MSAPRHIVAMQRGMSLVELMVAMAIGLFLLAGAVTVFGKTRDLYRTNDTAARLQETARYAMSTIEADLRLANYWGLMSRADLVENGPALNLASIPDVDPAYVLPADMTGFAATINSCGAMWAVKLPAYVEANDDAYGFSCAEFGTFRAGSDQLVVRRASTQVIPSVQLGSLAANNGRLKIRSSRVQASLFAGTTLPAGLGGAAETRPLVAHGYYVDQASDMDATTPSLRRKQLDFAGGAPVIVDREIVPGVEDLQVEFGADLDNDQSADYFVQPGTAIPAGDQVVAVRVWLLVRAEQQETAFVDDRTYDYASRTGAAVITPNDAFRRVLVSKTIALRNTRR